ncbi:MAG: hypothetical protein GVY36_01095 [Verrucomicrobia bacterium]|nr:hypothetical protein [Verrucomicrobiota bacterium]
MEDESVAAVDDGRLPINRSVFDPGKPAVSDTAEAPATTSGVQLDFTKSSFGGDTGSSGFSFDDFANDTPQSEEADSFDLDVFGKEL